MNSLEKDTEIKENETKTKSEKFVSDADTNIRKEKKRPYQKGKVKLDVTRRKRRKREPIVRKKSPILNDEPRNKMIESDSSTVLFSPAQWQTDAADVTLEDMNLLFVKFTFDFFRSIKETPKTKEALISSWNNITKSKTQIFNLANSLPEIPICTCKDNNKRSLVFCDLCHYWYHLSCLHENANFNTNFRLNFYVCPCCIHGMFGSFFGYLSLSLVLLINGSKESITDASENWEKKANI